jgi:hypothetical protein
VNPVDGVRGTSSSAQDPRAHHRPDPLLLDSIDTLWACAIRALIGVMTYDWDVAAIDPTQARKRLCERRPFVGRCQPPLCSHPGGCGRWTAALRKLRKALVARRTGGPVRLPNPIAGFRAEGGLGEAVP